MRIRIKLKNIKLTLAPEGWVRFPAWINPGQVVYTIYETGGLLVVKSSARRMYTKQLSFIGNNP